MRVPATSLGPVSRPVPVRTIIATIGLVLLTALALLLLHEVQHVLVWIVVALFFTVALYPVVGWVAEPWRRSSCSGSWCSCWLD